MLQDALVQTTLNKKEQAGVNNKTTKQGMLTATGSRPVLEISFHKAASEFNLEHDKAIYPVH